MIIPYELLIKIFMYLPFEKAIDLDNYVAKKLFNKRIHTYEWAIEMKFLNVIDWLQENNKNATTAFNYAHSLKKKNKDSKFIIK